MFFKVFWLLYTIYNRLRSPSLNELIEEIKKHSPIELEIFVHGAVCLSYSGRCYLSEYMAARGANRGECAHPCRWRYALVEEKRPGQYYPITEDERGAYILNSRDLCLLSELPLLAKLNLSGWKIEGRVKGVYYLAAVVKAYREARDTYHKNGDAFTEKLPYWLAELDKVSHRPYFSWSETEKTVEQSSGGYQRKYQFLGLVREVKDDNIYYIEARNQIHRGEKVEVLNPHKDNQELCLEELSDMDGNPLKLVQPNQEFFLKTNVTLEKWAMLRRPVGLL